VTLGGKAVKTETGMRVIAIRRAGADGTHPDPDEDWVVSPGPQAELRGGDVLIAKGTREGATRLDALAGTATD
jgi:uncharacterized protein with PhoU and TrkA domain